MTGKRHAIVLRDERGKAVLLHECVQRAEVLLTKRWRKIHGRCTPFTILSNQAICDAPLPIWTSGRISNHVL